MRVSAMFTFLSLALTVLFHPCYTQTGPPCADMPTEGETDAEKVAMCASLDTSDECGCTWVKPDEGCSSVECTSFETTVGPIPPPTASPSPGPTVSPSPEPTASPSPGPTVSPSPEPTVSPSPKPTASPSHGYTVQEVNTQCYAHEVEFSGDRLDNPIWTIGKMTLSKCKAACNEQVDSKGRECVAIEWSDGGIANVQVPAGAETTCALAWACDFLEPWGGGSVYRDATPGCPGCDAAVGIHKGSDDNVARTAEQATGETSFILSSAETAAVTGCVIFLAVVVSLGAWYLRRRKRSPSASAVEMAETAV